MIPATKWSLKGLLLFVLFIEGLFSFTFLTLQIFALFLRPKKEHKSRFYWNIYHHGVGYAIIILGIINVFKGLHILEPEKKWKSTYVSILVVLGCITVLLEIFTWIVYLRRKSNRSTKPYAWSIDWKTAVRLYSLDCEMVPVKWLLERVNLFDRGYRYSLPSCWLSDLFSVYWFETFVVYNILSFSDFRELIMYFS